MIIAGLAIMTAGLILATNQFRIADRMAALSRPFPWWLKGIGADSPTTGRLTGAVLVIVGVVFVVAGVKAWID